MTSFFKQQQFFWLLLLALPFVFVNCGDDDDDIPRVVSANDFTATIVEKQAVGTVIGNVSATVPDGETATYELVNSNPSGAMALSATGSLTIADATAFDFDVRQSVTGTFRATAGTISDEGSITVTLDDDGIIAPEDQRKTDGYVIVTATPGNTSYLAQYFEEVPSGMIDNSTGTDYTTFFPRNMLNGSIYFTDPNGTNNFVQLNVDGNGEFVVDGSIPYVGENSFALVIQNETTGVFHDRNDPTRLTIFNPTTMMVEATIDMSAGELPVDSVPQRYGQFFFRGDELYASVRPAQGTTYSSSFYHVADVSTGQYLRTVTIADEGLFFDNLYGRGNITDDGTLYLGLTNNTNNIPPTPGRIRRILPGQTDFDPDYEFRPAEVLNPANVFLSAHTQMILIGGQRAIARVASSIPQQVVDIVVNAGGVQNLDQAQVNEVLQLLFTQPTSNWCILDLEAQTVEVIPGIPTLSYFAGLQPTTDGEFIYMPVLTEQVNEVYRYSLSDGSVEKAFEVAGGGSIYGIYHLGEE